MRSPRSSCDHLAHKQHGYLNLPFFFVRQVIYFGVWTFVSWRLLLLEHSSRTTTASSSSP